MEFTAGAWWIVAGAAGIAVTIISYFLKRTINKTDDHDKAISEIQRNYVNKKEHAHDIDELKSELRQVSKDLSTLKDTTLKTTEFYRVMGRNEEKVDKMYDLILKTVRGGDTNGG